MLHYFMIMCIILCIALLLGDRVQQTQAYASSSRSYVGKSRLPHEETINRRNPSTLKTINLIENKFHRFDQLSRRPRSGAVSLNLDFFGLGPAEIIVIGAAVGLLFGPDRVKQQLRDKGVKGKIVSTGWRQDRIERIEKMQEYAKMVRNKRAMDRILKAEAEAEVEAEAKGEVDKKNVYEMGDGETKPESG